MDNLKLRQTEEKTGISISSLSENDKREVLWYLKWNNFSREWTLQLYSMQNWKTFFERIDKLSNEEKDKIKKELERHFEEMQKNNENQTKVLDLQKEKQVLKEWNNQIIEQLKINFELWDLQEKDREIAKYIESKEYKSFSNKEKFQTLLFILSNSQSHQDLYWSLVIFAKIWKNSEIQKFEWPLSVSLEASDINNLDSKTVSYMTNKILKDIWITLEELDQAETQNTIKDLLWSDANFVDMDKLEIRKMDDNIVVDCKSAFNNALLGNFHNPLQRKELIKNKDFFNFCERKAQEVLEKDWEKLKSMWIEEAVVYIESSLEKDYNTEYKSKFTEYQKSHLRGIYWNISAWSKMTIKKLKNKKVVTMRTGKLPMLVSWLMWRNYNSEYTTTLQHEIQHADFWVKLQNLKEKWVIKEPWTNKERHLLYSTIDETIAHMRNSRDKEWFIDFGAIKNNLLWDRVWDYTRNFEKDLESLWKKIDEIVVFIQENYPKKFIENGKFIPNGEAIEEITEKCLNNPSLWKLHLSWWERILLTGKTYLQDFRNMFDRAA